MRRCALVALLWVISAGIVPAGNDADVEAAARKVEAKLMAPCCGSNVLAQHHSGPAEGMKQEIRAFLAQGRTEQQVLDFYVARHGERILAMPRARGFNLLAYLLPGLLLFVGGAWVAVALRRWTRRNTPALQSDRWTPPSPADAERVRQALERMG